MKTRLQTDRRDCTEDMDIYYSKKCFNNFNDSREIKYILRKKYYSSKQLRIVFPNKIKYNNCKSVSFTLYLPTRCTQASSRPACQYNMFVCSTILIIIVKKILIIINLYDHQYNIYIIIQIPTSYKLPVHRRFYILWLAHYLCFTSYGYTTDCYSRLFYHELLYPPRVPTHIGIIKT